MKKSETILVIGATGLLGEIAARQFVSDGYSVKALVRNTQKARDMLPREIELVKGDITKMDSVFHAAKNVNYIHISISGGNESDEIFKVESEGVRHVIKAAQKLKIKRITMISGMSVNEENQSHPSEKAKLLAERELENSGLKYTIFKPGFFMETLQKFVQKDKALLLGKQPHPLHMIAAKDLMRNISRSYGMPVAENKSFYVTGNEAFLLKDALQAYVSKLYPGMKVSVMPLWIIKPINRIFMKGKLTRAIGIMELLQRKGEEGNPQEYLRIFGTHPTTFKQWLNNLAKIRSKS